MEETTRVIIRLEADDAADTGVLTVTGDLDVLAAMTLLITTAFAADGASVQEVPDEGSGFDPNLAETA